MFCSKSILFKNEYNKEIEKAVSKINQKEKCRYSLPKPDLTELEMAVLYAIIEGRSAFEINKALKNTQEGFSYPSMVHSLRRKFKAVTLNQVIYKAVKCGII